MKKLRKTLGSVDFTYIVSLMKAIETQSKNTICNWCFDYAEKNILPIYENHYPGDLRPREALGGARKWLIGDMKFSEAKKRILKSHAAAREAADNPAAQAAARAIGQAASSIHMPSHSLGLAFYGAAAIAYNKVGLNEADKIYDEIAAIECAKMQKALEEVSNKNEENPAKIKWRF